FPSARRVWATSNHTPPRSIGTPPSTVVFSSKSVRPAGAAVGTRRTQSPASARTPSSLVTDPDRIIYLCLSALFGAPRGDGAAARLRRRGHQRDRGDGRDGHEADVEGRVQVREDGRHRPCRRTAARVVGLRGRDRGPHGDGPVAVAAE